MDEVSKDPRYPKYLQPVEIPSPEGLSFADHEILSHQLDLQVFFLQQEVDVCNFKLRLDSSEFDWKFRDEIQRLLTDSKMKLKALEDSKPPKKLWQDRVKLWLYYWSVQGRLEKEEVL